jgi:hypothetical protein
MTNQAGSTIAQFEQLIAKLPDGGLRDFVYQVANRNTSQAVELMEKVLPSVENYLDLVDREMPLLITKLETAKVLAHQLERNVKRIADSYR